MKRYLLSVVLIISFGFSGCKDTSNSVIQSNKEGIKSSQKKTSENVDFSVPECIHNALYYLETTDIKTYDSLDTRYFNEIMGYRQQEAIQLEERILSMKENIINDSTNNIPSFLKDEMQLEIDSLRNDLNSYDKEVIGYVFVHTYTSRGDTLSAIIMMNKDCSNWKTIPVQTIYDIDPNDYAYQVQRINEKEI